MYTYSHSQMRDCNDLTMHSEPRVLLKRNTEVVEFQIVGCSRMIAQERMMSVRSWVSREIGRAHV